MGIFKKGTLETVKPEKPLENVAPVKLEPRPKGAPVSRGLLVETLLKIIKRDVEGKLRETHGKNRSPRIDDLNRRGGGYSGAPYCTSALWCAYDDACKILDLKNPIPRTASSQKFYTQSPLKYRKSRPQAGDAMIQTQRKEPAYGHAGCVREEMRQGEKTFKTYEYNTGPDGGRDGDGAYSKTRDLDGDSSKKLRGFIDCPQWILDANGVK